MGSRVLGCSVALCCAFACRSEPAQPSPVRPNVIIVTVDTLRPDHLGCYGHGSANTPTFDRVATEGVRFAQATTSLPRTTPALASLLTGLEPRHHGVREVGTKLQRGTSLATFLQQAGYTTIGLSGTPVAGPDQRLDRGFSRFKVLPLEPAQLLTEWALEQVERAPDDRPLLLWVHYNDPHFDYRPPRAAPQPEAPGCRALMERIDRKDLDRGEVFANRDGVAAAALPDCRALYDAEITYCDTWIGRLFDGLRSQGRLSNAHVLLSADHGEHLGERGLYYEHGPTVHDADLRIPLIWSGPGLARGRVDRSPVRLEDITPTLLKLLGIERSDVFDGRDLRARLDARSAPAPDDQAIAFAESGSALQPHLFQFITSGQVKTKHCTNGPRYSLCEKRGEQPQLFDRTADPRLLHDLSASDPAAVRELEAARKRWPPRTAREYAARGVRFKLVQIPLLAGGYRSALYDLENDPAETSDVSTRWPDVRVRLESSLSAWVANTAAPDAPEPDGQTQEALRALGYVQ